MVGKYFKKCITTWKLKKMKTKNHIVVNLTLIIWVIIIFGRQSLELKKLLVKIVNFNLLQYPNLCYLFH